MKRKNEERITEGRKAFRKRKANERRSSKFVAVYRIYNIATFVDNVIDRLSFFFS